ncbi:MAG: hypothetical protein K2X48_05040 [Chitinophagaceae bacterium]|nr:hypothetical protein [Chitinophagaceae bacterium]
MQSACITGSRVIGSFILSIVISINVLAQDNSPFSRYGLGDLVPSSNITNRGMGGLSAAYGDFQTINFVNPASYQNFGMQRAIFDVGLDINNRTLRNNTGGKYSSSNAIIPYLAAGFQIKPQKSKTTWGLVFGLKPLTKVSYNITSGSRFSLNDSIIRTFEGSGGTYQAFMGMGFGIKNFSVGFNTGYRFGSKDYSTKVELFNDTVPNRYTPAIKEIKNNFGGVFAELGLQYRFVLNKKTSLTLGGYGSMQTVMNATREEKYESYFPLASGGIARLDSVSETKNIKGKIEYPSYYGFGFLYDVQNKSKLMLGADVVMYNWASYRYYGAADALQNSWQVKAGAQYIPDITGDIKKGYWSSVMYRAGFNFAKEPYTINGNMNSFGVSIGAGLPIKKYSYAEINRSNIVNMALEFGQRGNNASLLRENYFRLSVGFSLSDIWFIKRKYD